MTRRPTRLALALALVLTPAPSTAWDSVCVEAEGRVDFSSEATTPFCVPIYARDPRGPSESTFSFCNAGGYVAAQGIYGGEHAFITARALADLGLDAYGETHEHKVAIWAPDETFTHAGRTHSTLTPAAFTHYGPLRRHERPYTVTGFSELPDFGSSLADWASGYEHCAIANVARRTREEVQTCHEFTEVLGPVNSNHFVPQARAVFEHYHALALELISECKALSETAASWPHAERSRTLVHEVLAECERHALSLAAIGQHHLQDAFSTGHMWERWGTPRVPSADSLPDAKAVAMLSGVIHGWRTLVEPVLVDQGAVTGGVVLGTVSQDPLSAPVDELSGQYRFDGALYNGVGDDYVLPCIQLYQDPTLSSLYLTQSAGNVAEFDEQFRAQQRCVATALLEVYRAGPMLAGEPTTPAYLAGVAPDLHHSDACFSRRASNAAMYRALGFGSFAVAPSHLALLELTVTRVTGVVGQVVLNVPSVRRWRNALVSLNAAFYLNQLQNPGGGESADLALGPELATVFGFGKNSDYLAEAVPDQADAAPLSRWSVEASGACAEDADCAAPLVCNRAAARCESPEAATLRVFNRAHTVYWCDATTREDLDLLRDRCVRDEERCDVCVELARRHVRNACDEPSWQDLAEDQRVDALCRAHDPTGGAPLVYAGGLEHCQSAYRDADEAALAWCQTEDLATIGVPDPGAARPRLEATSPGGLHPPPVAPGETVTLEVRYLDAALRPAQGQVIRFARFMDLAFETCLSPSEGDWSVSDPDGYARFPVTTAAGHPEKVYVRACPTEDEDVPCNVCDPNTLTFVVESQAGTILRKLLGDGQHGPPGSELPVQLTVEASPPVPNGTLIRFSTADLGLPPGQRPRLDGAETTSVDKATIGSRAAVRLTLPATEGAVAVTAAGLDPERFPDPAASAVTFSATSTAARPLGSLRFSYYQGSPIGAMEVEVTVVHDGMTSVHTASVSDDRVAVTIPDVAPIGEAVTVTLAGTNALGVGFSSAPIPIDFFLERHDLGQVFLRADRGHLIIRAHAPPTGTSVSQRSLLLFDWWTPWPAAVIPDAPAQVEVGVDTAFNVPFQPFVTNAGEARPRRHLELFLYAPGNDAQAASWAALMSDDRYLWLAEFGLGPDSHPPPSEALVSAYLQMGLADEAVVGAPLKVYAPDGTLVFEDLADWPAGGPFWFPGEPEDPRIVTGGYDFGEGFVTFAANGDEFPVSPDGLLFVVIDPPLEDYRPSQRAHCMHDRGNVQRIMVTTPASCERHDDCRPLSGPMTGLCESGRCFDYNYPEIRSRDATCDNSGAPVSIGRCAEDFSCGPERRCVDGACVP